MKRAMFIGQAMPRIKEHPHDWPSLNSWLYSIGVTDKEIKKYFFYSALVNYFPGSRKGSHLIPTNKQITKERLRLKKDLIEFSPDVIVTVGRLSLTKCIGQEVKLLSDFVGKTFNTRPYNLTNKKILIIPLPHPSGASTWYRKKANKLLLTRALGLLRRNIQL